MRIAIGPGDDAAVVWPSGRPLVMTTDALVEGVHFRSGWLSPAELGARAALVNLSDLAAMAAEPTNALLAVTAPSSFQARQLDALIDGCAAALAEHGAALVGGNLSRSPLLTLTLTAIGELHGEPLRRDTARPGDRLFVSGTLGDASAALSFLLRDERPPEVLRSRWVSPTPRLELARRLAGAGVRTGLDLSDGLLVDTGHLCRASGVGARLRLDHLPLSAAVRALDGRGVGFAIPGGEDYELLLAVSPQLVERITGIARDLGTPLHEIGEIIEGSKVELMGEDGRPLGPVEGFDHFHQAEVRP